MALGAVADFSASMAAAIAGHRSRGGGTLCASSSMRFDASRNDRSSHTSFQSALVQQAARPMQLRLAGPDGDAEHRRGLRMFVPIHTTQHQRVARALRQGLIAASSSSSSTGVSKVRPALRIRWGLRPRFRRSTDRAAFRARCSRRSGAARWRSCCAPRTRQRLPGLDEGVLGAVGCQVRIARHAQAQPVHPTHVFAVEALEGPRIARACALDERHVEFDDRVGSAFELNPCCRTVCQASLQCAPWRRSRGAGLKCRVGAGLASWRIAPKSGSFGATTREAQISPAFATRHRLLSCAAYHR